MSYGHMPLDIRKKAWERDWTVIYHHSCYATAYVTAASFCTKILSPRQVYYRLDSPKQQGCKLVRITSS